MKKLLLVPFFLLIITARLMAADYFWVKGTGIWSDLNHWATTSGGGTSQFQVPTANDNVHFDANSFTGPNQVVTITYGGGIANVVCQNMDWTGALYNPMLFGNSSQTLRIYGSLTFIPAMTFSFAGVVYFEATSPGNTVTSAGMTFNNDVVFRGGGEWTLQDDFHQTGNMMMMMNSKGLNLSSGNLSTGGHDVFCDLLTINAEQSCGLDITGSEVTINGNQTMQITGQKLKLSAKGSTIIMGVNTYNMSCSASNLQFGNLIVNSNQYFNLTGGFSNTWKNVSYNGSNGQINMSGTLNIDTLNSICQSLTLNDSMTIGNLISYSDISFKGWQGHKVSKAELYNKALFEATNKFDTLILSPGRVYTFKDGVTQRINKYWSLKGTCSSPIILQSSSSGNQATISVPSGNVAGEYLSIKDIRATGGATFIANNSVDLGDNNGWTINTAASLSLYWVGGTGNWDDPTHWSVNSGGVGGACLPTAIDDVYFDEKSFNATGQTVTINQSNAIGRNMTWTGAKFNPTFTGPNANALHIYGSLTFIPAMTFSFEGVVYFDATTSGNTVTSAGKTFNNDVVFRGGGEWTLQDDFHQTGNMMMMMNSKGLNLSSGNLSTGGHDVFCDLLTINAEQSCGLDITGSEVTINGNQTMQITGQKLKLSAKGSTIIMGVNTYNMSCSASNLQFGNLIVNSNQYFNLTGGFSNTWKNVSYNGSNGQINMSGTLNIDTLNSICQSLTLNDSMTIGNLISYSDISFKGWQGHKVSKAELYNKALFEATNKFDTLILSPGRVYTFKDGVTQRINKYWSLKGTCSSPIILQSSSSGNQATISVPSGNVAGEYLSIKDIRATGGATFIANNSVDLGDNNGWTINTAASLSLYWVGGTGNWDDPTHWSVSSGGVGGACLPTAIDDVYFDEKSFNATGQTVTINQSNAIGRNMTWTGAKFNPTFTGPNANALHIYGSLTFIPAMTFSFAGVVYFEATTSGNTVTSAGKTFNNDVVFRGGGEWTLQDDFHQTGNMMMMMNSKGLNLSSGNLSTGGHDVFCDLLTINAEQSCGLDITGSEVTINGNQTMQITGQKLKLSAKGSTIIMGVNTYNMSCSASNLQFGNLIVNSNQYFNLTGGFSNTWKNVSYNGSNGQINMSGTLNIDTLNSICQSL